MANSFDNLVADAYVALNQVSREMIGLIPAVSRNSTADRATTGQTIRIPVAPEGGTASNITAGQEVPDTGDETITNKTVTIDNFKRLNIRWTGEDVADLNTGPGWRTVYGNQLLEKARIHANDMENLLAGLYVGASNGVNPAGTTLFDAANYKDLAAVRRMLNVNGAPQMDRHLVLANGASEAFIGNAQNTAVDVSGENNMLMNGVLGRRFGFDLRESAQIQDHTAGTGTSVATDASGYAVGATSITLNTAGSETVAAGDIVYFDGDSNGYVVATGANATGGTITLAAPGLKQAIAASSVNVTIESSTQRNMAFSRNAIVLATRLPYAPPNGDKASNVAVITDQMSGISMELREYPEYRRANYELAVAYGAAVIKPEHLVLLAG